ncbi:MAG: DUF2169 domain-containing protein [Polyangiaceae bacterium]|nr:DUF2169 domain-containing protein [Polyangiaceae bacterium]
MLELRNRTPFAAAIVPGLDRDGRETVTVVVKGTFDLGRRADDPPISERQVPIAQADAFHGEPGASSIHHEADSCPAKRGTDVALVGHAWSPRPVPSLDVRLAAGPVEKTLRVIGDRVWSRTLGVWKMSDPAPFARMPLVYERAFGGVDRSDPDPAKHGWERRNPVGTGLALSESEERLEGLRLPNLEDPASLLAAPTDRPAPAGFGLIARDWMPRLAHAGTYDERWRRDRCPFLPEDFDDRFFHAAHPDLTSARKLRGGEPVAVEGAAEGGDVRFAVPRVPLEVAIRIRGEVARHRPGIDTLLIEPDDRRVVITWRVTAPCARRFLYIDDVKITRPRGAA